eukprot:3129629-Pyramimonas_sp.AAC.1
MPLASGGCLGGCETYCLPGCAKSREPKKLRSPKPVEKYSQRADFAWTERANTSHIVPFLASDRT